MPNKDALAGRIGKNLKAFRQGLGLSQKNLAAASGLSPTLISRIEGGLVMPSIATLQEIADSLKVDIGYFFKGEETKSYVIARKGSRKISYAKRGPKGKVTYRLELLAEGMENPFMEPCIVTERGPRSSSSQNMMAGVYLCPGRQLELTLRKKLC
jgi:transcriptional regulator with XRE-family HTH domain